MKKKRKYKKMSFVATLDDRGALTFGKHKGCSLSEVPRSYIHWVIENCRIDASCRRRFYQAAEIPVPDPETKRFAFEMIDGDPDPTLIAPWEDDTVADEIPTSLGEAIRQKKYSFK